MGAHNHQTRNSEHNGINVDDSRSHLNKVLYGSGNVRLDVENTISQYKKAHAKTTECAEMILTANHKYFDSISPGWKEGVISPALQTWIDENVKFLKSKYPGLASAVLHLDEQAPHIHAMIIPVATYDISFRRGTKSVTRIAYNKIFGDDMSVIYQAREENNSELTKLGRLQTEYADSMKPLNLKRGSKSSTASNVTPGEHIERINKQPAALPRIKTVVPEPSTSDLLLEKIGVDTDHSNAVKQLEKEKSNRLNTGLKQIDLLQSHSIELQIVKPLVEQQKKQLMDKDAIIAALQLKVSKLDTSLTLEKTIVNTLRNTPMQAIADALEYDGVITWKNAIDMVKELGGLSYVDSVSWLYSEFGEGVAIGASIDYVKTETSKAISATVKRPFTAAENTKKQEIEKQLVALDADNYRITLMGEGELPSYNLGKGKGVDGVEQLYDKNAIIENIPLLSKENRRGYNVFITPMSDTKKYMLIDDLNNNTLNKLITDGYTPCTIIQTSKNSIQAVIASVEQDDSKQVLNSVFKELNKTYGDPNIVAQVHPFRLVGFTNRKLKHLDAVNNLYPFVRLIKFAKILCSKTADFLRSCARLTDDQEIPAGRLDLAELHTFDAASLTLLNAAERDKLLDESRRFYRLMEGRYGAAIDLSRADWMLAQRLKKEGYSVEIIAAVMHETSPKIASRHANAVKYASRTAINAKKPI